MSEGRRAWAWAIGFAVGGSLTALLGVRWLLPLAQAVPAWLILQDALRRGRPWRAAALMLCWALAASVTLIELTRLAPAAVERATLRGPEYRAEMFHWIRTGEGAEGEIARFLPQHLRHYGLTLALSFASAGLLGLGLGAVLLNYMNFYVGELVRAAVRPEMASAVGWPVWSVLRVIGFVIGAVAAAHLLLGPVLRRAPWKRKTAMRMAAASLALVAADVVFKWLLAPVWRRLLDRALGF